jgi:hypothetical protein
MTQDSDSDTTFTDRKKSVKTREELLDEINQTWNHTNVETLTDWLILSSFNMQVLDKTITLYRGLIRKNIILGLILSTSSGTISASRINQDASSYMNTLLNILFTLMTFAIAIFTGYIKIYQIQEQLENFIRIKQEWVSFGTLIASEMQLPIEFRQKASTIIEKNKAKYLDLLKTDLDIPLNIKYEVEKNLGLKEMKSSLSEIIIQISYSEAKTYGCAIGINMDIINKPKLTTYEKILQSIGCYHLPQEISHSSTQTDPLITDRIITDKLITNSVL